MARRSAVTVIFTGYGLIGLLTGVTALLVLIHAGRLLNYGFPIMAAAVAAALFSTRRSVYAAYVWWIWLFTPLVRRLVDYQTTYHNFSPVIVSPLLVTGLALVAVLRRPQVLLRRRMLPFLAMILLIGYATIVGAATNTPLAALYDMANWLLPLAFAVFLLMYPAEYPEIREAMVFAVISGLVALSAYGLYQFYAIPPWDAYWLNASKFTSAGVGYAEQVRLFGTLNSPAPYGIVLMTSLVFVAVAKGPLRVVAGGLGVPAFGLSLVRSAWGGLALALMFIVWRVGGKTRLRMFAAILALSIVAVPLLVAGPVADALSARLATLSNLGQDESFRARESLYENSAVIAVSQPIGVGFGGIGNAAKLVNGQAGYFDSGILLVPYQFGWAGTTVFVWAIGALLMQVLRVTRRSTDRVGIAGGGLFIAMVSQNIFATSFSSVAGIALWIGFALALGSAPVNERIRNPSNAAVGPVASQTA
jgi:hypothetical protein